MTISKLRLPNIELNMPSRDNAAAMMLAAKQMKLKKKNRQRVIRWGLVVSNLTLLLIVAIFLLSNRSASQTVRSSTLSSATSTASSTTNPLDRLSSAQIALTAAQMTNMTELTAVKNQADSDSLLLAVVPNDSTALSKPQIISTAGKSKKDIINYVVLPGEDVNALATKFGVSADSIKWSNSLNGNTLTAGAHLVIPPINGIVYTVKNNDTPASLASKYSSDANQIIAYNDAEVGGLKPGDRILIPNGRLAAAAAVSRGTVSYGSFIASYGGNGYDYGYCTYYAASRVSVPTNWGNANTWDNYARLSGWTVSTVPVAGAIAQTDAMSYLGHVAYVEAVSADGTQMKYSDMNGIAGWGRVGYSDWVSSTTFQHYIYH
jgi:surface antigen